MRHFDVDKKLKIIDFRKSFRRKNYKDVLQILNTNIRIVNTRIRSSITDNFIGQPTRRWLIKKLRMYYV